MVLLDWFSPLSSSLSWSEAMALLKPLSLFIIGVGIYSLFIFKFYRFVARREIFKVDFKKFETSEHAGVRKFFHGLFYLVKYVVIFPILTFFWFIVLAVILAFLSKSGDMQTVLLIAMALVGTIRIMSYYTEDLSKDLAKMMPFALLGVFLVDISYFSLSDSIATIQQIPSLWKTIAYYLGFVIVLEFLLRILYSIFSSRKDKKEKKED